MTQQADHLQLARYISDIDSYAKSKGITLSVRSDFDYLWKIWKKLPGKPEPSVLFDPAVRDVSEGRAFWIRGTNSDGEIVHVQAARCDDLTGTNLARDIDSLTKCVAEPSTLPSSEDTGFCQAPAAKEITGKVCYHGEIWLRGGNSGYRGQGLASILPRLVLALAHAKWAPNYMWGLGQQWLIDRGLPQQYGYRYVQPRGTYWKKTKYNRPIDSWIMWMSGRELAHLIQAPSHAYQAAETEYQHRELFPTGKPQQVFHQTAC